MSELATRSPLTLPAARRGALAWWLWGVLHIYFLVGLRNRMSVMFDWFWAYLTYRVSIRLITGDDAQGSLASRAEPLRKAS